MPGVHWPFATHATASQWVCVSVACVRAALSRQSPIPPQRKQQLQVELVAAAHLKQLADSRGWGVSVRARARACRAALATCLYSLLLARATHYTGA
jgi:hypothetical protein